MSYGVSANDDGWPLARADMKELLDLMDECIRGGVLTDDEADVLNDLETFLGCKAVARFGGQSCRDLKSAFSKLRGDEESEAFARYLLYLIGDAEYVSFDS